jgi:hypothetical protein
MKNVTILTLGLALSSLMFVAAEQTTTPSGQQPTAPSTQQSTPPPADQQPTTPSAQQPTTPPSTQQSTAPSASQQGTTPTAQPTMIPPSKANNPAPPPSAQSQAQKNSVGKGSLTVTTAKPVSFWQEQASNGAATITADLLYDPNVGVLYGYWEDDYTCSNGQTGHGGVLEALNTSSNAAGKPVGSGWWAVDLSNGKCGAKQTGLYGCKFDANGNATECGAATILNKTGEIDVVGVQ